MSPLPPTLRTSELARMLSVSPNTIRSWDRRYGFPSARTAGDHRRFPMSFCLAMRQAIVEEQLSPSTAFPRARQLAESGVLLEPRRLHVRMDQVEKALRDLTITIERLAEQLGQTP